MNEFYDMRIQLEKTRWSILQKTRVWRLDGGNTTHAIISLVYCIYAQTNREDADKLLSFVPKFPWIKKGKDNVPQNVSKDVKLLFDYFLALEKCYTEVPELVKKTVKFAEDAASLTTKAKADLDKADSYTKGKATKSVPFNISMLKKAKNVVSYTMGLLKDASVELKNAYEVLKEEKEDLPEYGKTLADEGITEPIECYRRVGKPIENPEKIYTEEELLDFPYEKPKKKGEEDYKDGEEELSDYNGQNVS